MSGRAPRKVAFVAVPGVGTATPGDVARDLAAVLFPGGATGRGELHVSVPRERAVVAYDTVLLEGDLGGATGHVVELRWGDLSKRRPTLVSIVTQLLELVPRVMQIAETELRAAETASGGAVGARALRLGYLGLVFFQLGVLPVGLAWWVATAAMRAPVLLPVGAPAPVAIAVGLAASFLLGSLVAYRYPSLLKASAPLRTVVASSAIFGALALAGASLPEPERGGRVAAVTATAGAAALVCAVLRPLVVSWRSDPTFSRLLGALSWSPALLPAYVWFRFRDPRAVPSTEASAIARDVTGRASQAIAWGWVLTVALVLVLAIAGGRAAAAKARSWTPWQTARLAVTLMFALNGFALGVLQLLVPKAIHAQITSLTDFANLVFMAVRLTYVPIYAVVLLVTVATALWTLAPPTIAAPKPPADGPPAPADADEAALRQATWVSHGRSILGRVVRHGPYFVIFGVFPLFGASLFAVELFYQMERAYYVFFVALAGATVALPMLLKSAKGLSAAWPYLAIALDVDFWLREDTDDPRSPRAAVVARAKALIARFAESEYTDVVLVGHGQGSVIAVDLARTTVVGRRWGVGLVTMGSPLRALHAAMMPSRFEPVLAGNGGAGRWLNLFFAGDYIGRGLWAPDVDPNTYVGEYQVDSRTDVCLGAGGHTEYWTDAKVGEKIRAFCKLMSVERPDLVAELGAELGYAPGAIDTKYGGASGEISMDGREGRSRAEPQSDLAPRAQCAPTVAAGEQTRVFVVCAEADKRYLDELEIHLAPLEKSSVIKAWHRGQALAGAVVEREVADRLDEADLVLLLISPDFMASSDCSKDMARALKRRDGDEGQGIAVVPILIRPVAGLAEHPLGGRRALPRGGRAVSQWPTRDDAWVDVVEGLRALLKKRGPRGS
ncbi:MAG TPA: toll/interleukin-1 receptor domain-containing protein [Polyangiaceae bacterium]|nr:toll/interleukin-1 receptor domain-containing protein [Polyangiaceae bacterium]